MNTAVQVKFFIQRLLRKTGWEMSRVVDGEDAQLVLFFNLYKVDTVLDVGANIGQFANAIRQAGFKGRIISFEPQSEAHVKLKAFAANSSNWTVFERCAVGSTPGETEINLSQNSFSSSILDIEKLHTSNAPGSKYSGKEKVDVITLDQCKAIPKSGNIFLKVDTQGFEKYVLDGAKILLDRLVGVQLETSLAELYKGQTSFIELLTFMDGRGYDIWSINRGFDQRETGQLFQADVTFKRRQKLL